MAETITEGAVVELKSGGPRMSVEWVRDGTAYCTWFDDKAMQHSKAIKTSALQPATSMR